MKKVLLIVVVLFATAMYSQDLKKPSEGKSLVCVGGTGVHFSNDSGATWKKLAEDKDLYTLRFRNDSVAYAAGRNRVVELKFKE